MKIIVTLFALLAIAPALSAQTTWEIRFAERWPILDAVVDSIDGLPHHPFPPHRLPLSSPLFSSLEQACIA